MSESIQRKPSRWIERSISICGFIILMVVTLIGWNSTSNKSAAESAVMKATVDRLEKEWNEYDFGVFEYKLEAMDKKLDEIKALVKELN